MVNSQSLTIFMNGNLCLSVWRMLWKNPNSEIQKTPKHLIYILVVATELGNTKLL